MRRPLRLLSYGHSYTVGENRRLVTELARAGGRRWELVVGAPTRFLGPRDLRAVELDGGAEGYALRPLRARLARRVHVFVYGRALRRLLQEGWDLVHCWEEPFIFAGAQAAAWTPAGTPLVYYTFQNIPKRYPPPFSWLERLSLARASGWIAAGHTVHEALHARPGYRERPSATIALGVDLDTFRPDPGARAAARRELGWSDEGPPVVGFLGRFVPEKGLALLTEALAGLPEWRALFVGAGPLEGWLRSWAARYPGRARVHTEARHGDVPRFLNAMDLLCAPSQTTPRWREQFGRMTVEAFACGVPVIGSDSGEIPHVIGEAGVVLPERDGAAWQAAIGALLQSRDRRVELRERGLARARERFAWPVIARETLAFCEAQLGSARA